MSRVHSERASYIIGLGWAGWAGPGASKHSACSGAITGFFQTSSYRSIDCIEIFFFRRHLSVFVLRKGITHTHKQIPPSRWFWIYTKYPTSKAWHGIAFARSLYLISSHLLCLYFKGGVRDYASQSRAEQSRAEQSRAEQNRTGQYINQSHGITVQYINHRTDQSRSEIQGYLPYLYLYLYIRYIA